MPLLTLKQIQDHLAKITYRPGWTMTAYEGHTYGMMIEVKGTVEDSTTPGEYQDLEVYSHVPPQKTVEDFELWLFDRLKIIEIHECAEWFQVGGKAPFYPHRPYAERDILPV